MSGPTCDVPHQNAWYGTHCSTGAIYSLELRGNNLHGTLPTQLGALPNLWALRLESNPLLSGTVPTEIGALQNLKILDLGNSTISGSLPEELLLLTQLVFLDTQGNAFSGTLPSLRPWPNVMHLNMADNSISGSLPRFEMMQDLSYMSLHSNRFSGSIPTHVALLTNLRDRLHDPAFPSSIVPQFDRGTLADGAGTPEARLSSFVIQSDQRHNAARTDDPVLAWHRCPTGRRE